VLFRDRAYRHHQAPSIVMFKPRTGPRLVLSSNAITAALPNSTDPQCLIDFERRALPRDLRHRYRLNVYDMEIRYVAAALCGLLATVSAHAGYSTATVGRLVVGRMEIRSLLNCNPTGTPTGPAILPIRRILLRLPPRQQRQARKRCCPWYSPRRRPDSICRSLAGAVRSMAAWKTWTTSC
jgi:hypothetical protein